LNCRPFAAVLIRTRPDSRMQQSVLPADSSPGRIIPAGAGRPARAVI